VVIRAASRRRHSTLVLGDLGAHLGKFEHLMTSTSCELHDAVVAACAARASERVDPNDVDMVWSRR
jgi:hypothetical protein